MGGYHLSRRLIVWAFERLFAEVEPPEGHRIKRPAPAQTKSPVEESPLEKVAWSELGTEWDSLRDRIRSGGEVGAEFLHSVKSIHTRGRTLVLEVGGRGLVRWVSSDGPQRVLVPLIERRVEAPPQWRLEAELASDREAAAARTERTLQRRYEDLVRGDPETEDAANTRLASGYQLPGQRKPGK